MRVIHVAALHLRHDWFDWVASHCRGFEMVVIAGDLQDAFSNISMHAQAKAITRWLLSRQVGSKRRTSGTEPRRFLRSTVRSERSEICQKKRAEQSDSIPQPRNSFSSCSKPGPNLAPTQSGRCSLVLFSTTLVFGRSLSQFLTAKSDSVRSIVCRRCHRP